MSLFQEKNASCNSWLMGNSYRMSSSVLILFWVSEKIVAVNIESFSVKSWVPLWVLGECVFCRLHLVRIAFPHPHPHPALVRGPSRRPRWAGSGEEASGPGWWPGHHQGSGEPAETTLAQLLELLATGTAFSGPALLVLSWGARAGAEKWEQTFPAGPGGKGGESGDPLDPGVGSVNGPGLAQWQEQNSVPPTPLFHCSERLGLP